MMLIFCVGLCVMAVVTCIKGIQGNNSLFLNRSFFDEFECGFMASHPSNPSMVFSYIVIGVFYVVFDLEIALLLSIPYQGILYFNFFWFVCFIVILSVGYVIEVHSGYVRWSK